MHIRFDTTATRDLLQEQLVYRKIEFSQMRKQLEMFATFLPNYIITEDTSESKSVDNLPFVGVILDVHITGMHNLIGNFNKFSDGGIYKLTSTMNALLGIIIESVTYWGGDVVKIFGNNCLNLWKVATDESLYEILHLVVLCACIIKDTLNDFYTTVSHKLSIKMTIVCGNLHFSSYGDEVKIYLLRGEAMERLIILLTQTKSGEICLSSRAWAHMVQERYDAVRTETGAVTILSGKITYKANESEQHQYFANKEDELRELLKKHMDFMQLLHRNRRIDTLEVITKLANEFVQTIPERNTVKMASRICNLNRIRSFVCERVQAHVDSHQPVEYLTEITTLTVQVICLKPNDALCMSDSFIRNVFHDIREFVQDPQSFIYKMEAAYDIKVVIINGLHCSRQDIESQRALRSSYKISQHFQNIPGVHWISVGVLEGSFYCGVLGHPYRRNYTILGTALSKAFRIINRYRDKVICDFKTFKFSKLSSFYFRCLSRRCKRLFDQGQLLEYNEEFESNEQNVFYTKNFQSGRIFGRKKELADICEVIESQAPGGLGIVLVGPEKLGKSGVIDVVLKRFKSSNNFIIGSVCLQELTTTPYFVIAKIYQQLYDINTRLQGNISTVLTLPAELLNPVESSDDEDIAYYKYRILNNFRDMICFGSDRVCFIIIDDFQYIDRPSWEILEITLRTSKVRLLATAYFDRNGQEVYDVVSKCEKLTFYTIEPLSDYWINTVACYLLGVDALSTPLSAILIKTCRGRPGHVQNCLLYFINSENLNLVYALKGDITLDYIPIHHEIFDKRPREITIMTFSDNTTTETVTLASITHEFYISLEPFEQNILKVSAVLGTIFTRNLLIVALHYPDSRALAQGIKSLFDKEILACGSSMVNGYPINRTQGCCRCYMSDIEMAQMRKETDTYKYCKVIHFRNESMKTVVYDLIPVNQKKDLHLLCTDVLESTIHKCPNCLRNPIDSFLLSTRYKAIVECCQTGKLHMTECNPEHGEHLKECVRRTIRGDAQQIAEHRIAIQTLRNYFDPDKCYCLYILPFVYRQLIHHSTNARHLSKRIYFFTVYGIVLIIARDVVNAIAVLREAFELATVKMYETEITENFRKYHIGRITMGLATAFLNLRQVKHAKSYMAIALRQFNVPSLVFNFVHHQLLLNKSYLVNTHTYQPLQMQQTWMKWEFSICLILCARIYSAEGKFNYARYCSSYAIWILRQMNERIPMLFDAYCTAIELYRYGNDKEICEKLQKYVFREAILNYGNNCGYFSKHIMYLLNVDFELKVNSGRLDKAVRMCYRVVDFSMKVYIYRIRNEVGVWLSTIFCYTLRFKEFLDLIQILKKSIYDDSLVWYYANALDIALLTGYSYVPIDALLKNIYSFLNYNPQDRVNLEKSYLLSILYLHMMKAEMYVNAEKYKPNCHFNSTTMKKPILVRILLNLIEATMIEICIKKRRNNSFSRLEISLNKEFAMAKMHIKHLQILHPRFYALTAWKYQLFGNPKRATKLLKKTEEISKKQGNLYHVCLVRQLRHHWKGNAPAFHYRTRVHINLREVLDLNLDQWSQVILPFPIN